MGHKRHHDIANGDEALTLWGDAKRNGNLEALMHARSGGLSEGRPVRIRQRGDGTHTNPPLAICLVAEQHKMHWAQTIDGEVSRWRRDPATRLWAVIAEVHYANPYRPTNADTARALDVSVRTIVGARSKMRREVMQSLRGAVELIRQDAA